MATRKHTKLSCEVDRHLYIEGLTRADLASQLGVGKSYVSAILTGKQRLNVPMSNRIANIVGIDPRTLRKLALDCDQERGAV